MADQKAEQQKAEQEKAEQQRAEQQSMEGLNKLRWQYNDYNKDSGEIRLTMDLAASTPMDPIRIKKEMTALKPDLPIYVSFGEQVGMASIPNLSALKWSYGEFDESTGELLLKGDLAAGAADAHLETEQLERQISSLGKQTTVHVQFGKATTMGAGGAPLK